MSRATFYRYKKKIEYKGPLPDDDLAAQIQTIFLSHDGTYGYRRVALELRNRGYWVNRKKVQRIMRERGLRVVVRHCRRYSSYRGTVGKVAPNILKRNFVSTRPGDKVVGDVTEFRVEERKLYLSTFEDLCTREVVGYCISESPNMEMVMKSIRMAVERLHGRVGLVHTDQGWQYQNPRFVSYLKENGITQSMSRKGNCHDNAMAENFFSHIKKEMFYPQYKEIESIEDLRQRIEDYIEYYNEKRIQKGLMGLTPAHYASICLKLRPVVI